MKSANAFTWFALVGAFPAICALFVLLPPRRAVAAAFIGGWLFLPVAEIPLPGLPDYGKAMAVTLASLVAHVLLGKPSPDRVRFGLWDLPVVLWCICPAFSSFANGLGTWDAFATVVDMIFDYGVPYFLGRTYFCDREGTRALTSALVIGAIIYTPLCLWEARMSPSLHKDVYGFRPHWLGQAVRGGTWRPMVFLQHGLALALFMSTATFVAFWAWRADPKRKVLGMKIGVVFLGLFVATLVFKSYAAIALLILVMTVFAFTARYKTRVLVYCFLLIPTLYLGMRTVGRWDGGELLELSDFITGNSKERAQSLYTRIQSEEFLIRKAERRPLLGWGGWGRSKVGDERGVVMTDDGKFRVIVDSMWIIAFGKHGLVGIFSLLAYYLLPLYRLARRLPASRWREPEFAPVLALAACAAMAMFDNLLNAMYSPLFQVMVGGVVGWTARAENWAESKVNEAEGASRPDARASEDERQDAPGTDASDDEDEDDAHGGDDSSGTGSRGDDTSEGEIESRRKPRRATVRYGY